MPLAAFLSEKHVPVTAVRTSTDGIAPTTVDVEVELPAGRSIRAEVGTVSLSEIERVDGGIVVVAAKATANKFVAEKLRHRFANPALVIMQNGLGVERPFFDAGFREIYRCVLYATGLTIGKHQYRFREVDESPLGVVNGSSTEARSSVDRISTPGFRFRVDERIEKQAWKKTIINAAFNSICPLIDVDNGVFHRDDGVLKIAETVIDEASSVAAGIGIRFEERELIDQLLLISRRADGQLISTLQDINHGRETEIDYLNMEIARVGAGSKPAIDAPITRVLGEMILAKSRTASARS
ncbi:MAG: hypothetical protein MI919_10830 [Holophagales bacterium]|nr:hypothetical protein [Holophagales bacterium]